MCKYMASLSDIEKDSASFIHFLTNNTPKYVKLRNINGKYLNIIEPSNTTIDQWFVCDNIGAILKIYPTHNIQYFYLNLEIYMPNIDGEPGWFIHAISDSTSLKGAGKRSSDAQFMLEQSLNQSNEVIGYYIKTYHPILNRYMTLGRYLYTTTTMGKQDVHEIHTDGDKSIDTALWNFEFLNEPVKITDVRADYKSAFEQITTSPSIKSFLVQFEQKYVIKNKAHNMAISVSCNSIKQPSLNLAICVNNLLSYLYIRPNVNDNSVYISSFHDGKYHNLYTLPRDNKVYAYNGDCNWAKFYLVQKEPNVYAIQVFHREANKRGKYGRYLRVINSDDRYTITSDGNDADKDSWWTISKCI